MDSEKKIKIEINISKAMATMLELAIQEFVRNGGKLDDGLAVNERVQKELLNIAHHILNQISEKKNFF